jgi:hypothetical protein
MKTERQSRSSLKMNVHGRSNLELVNVRSSNLIIFFQILNKNSKKFIATLTGFES